MKPNKKTPEEMVVYLKRQVTDMEEDVYKLKAESARLKEINREMVELIKRIDLDVDDLIAGKVNMVNWAKRSLEISQVLNKAKAEGEKLDG